MRLVVAISLALVASSFGAQALAADAHRSALDAVASEVAGRPVSVYCEDSWAEWAQLIAAQPQQPSGTGLPLGFALTTGTVFISPKACEALGALLDYGPGAVGPYYAATSLLTLVHESVHERGVTDEGVADCTALSLLKDVATKSFGYQGTLTEHYMTSTIRTIRGLRIRVFVTKQRTVASPVLADLMTWAVAWHRGKPAAYQGTC